MVVAWHRVGPGVEFTILTALDRTWAATVVMSSRELPSFIGGPGLLPPARPRKPRRRAAVEGSWTGRPRPPVDGFEVIVGPQV